MYKRFNRKPKTRKKRKRFGQVNPWKSIYQNQLDYDKYWNHCRWDPYTYWPGRISSRNGMLPLRNFSTRRGIIPGQQINI
jgi:hypothetical protein